MWLCLVCEVMLLRNFESRHSSESLDILLCDVDIAMFGYDYCCMCILCLCFFRGLPCYVLFMFVYLLFFLSDLVQFSLYVLIGVVLVC